MIPSDLIARLRMQNDSFVQPLAPTHAIPSDLPELQVGQRFSARIEAVLSDSTFRALVAGRSITLALPESAKPGDTLDLVVLDRTPRMLVAGRSANAATAPGSAATPVAATTLSQAGQIISALLARAEGATGPAELVRTVPLLSAPPSGLATPGQAPQALPGAAFTTSTQPPQQGSNSPASVAQALAAAASATATLAPPSTTALLASALQQAITESGLFYESHQAQWVAGRRPLADLLREPQARHAPGLPSPTAASAPLATPVDLPAGKSAADSLGSPVRSTPADPLPPELQPLVQQQLDAAAHQPILWRGEVWPGQTMNWEIREEKERRDTSEEVAAQWHTRVRLVLPQLGELAADLSLTPAGVSIRLAAAEGRSSDALRNSLADLSAALGAAGVPLVAMKVDNGY